MRKHLLTTAAIAGAVAGEPTGTVIRKKINPPAIGVYYIIVKQHLTMKKGAPND